MFDSRAGEVPQTSYILPVCHRSGEPLNPQQKDAPMKNPAFQDVRVVGMHFRERDGIPAKSIVANFVPPVSLELEREPTNQYDGFAVKAIYNGQHIGYIEAGCAAFLAPHLDDGVSYTCTVHELVEDRRNLYPVVSLEPTE